MPDDTPQPAPAVLEKLTRDPSGHLIAHLSGCEDPVVDVRLARCFPWSLPEDYISVRKDDKEIALLETLEPLDDPTRKLVDEELRDKVFNPEIHRILDFKREFGVTSISVETDRGEVTFQLRSRDDVRFFPGGRALFRDADGNTYDLPNFNTLDVRSRKFLQEFF